MRNNVEFSGICVTLKLSVILMFFLVRVVYHYSPRCTCATLKCNCVLTHVFLIFCISLAYDGLVEAEIFWR